MVNLQKIDDSSVKFVFTDSDHYLVGNGEIVVPINSLSLVIDESEMVTFKKSATGDPFISFRADNSNLGTKEAIEEFYKVNMVGAGGGISEEEVQDMIDSATSGIPSSQVVEQLRTDVNTISANTYTKTQIDGFLDNATTMLTTISVDVQTNAANIRDINDTIDEKEEVIASALTEVRQDVADIDAKEEVIASALTEVRQDVDTLSGDVQTKVATSDFNAYSAATATALGNKQDALVFYSENEYDEETGEEATAEIHITGQGDSKGDSSGIFLQPYRVELGTSSEGENTTLVIQSDGVNINDERVLTEPDLESAKAYYVDFAAMSVQGITDADWDGLVAAINAHRPILVKVGTANGYVNATTADIFDNTIMVTGADEGNASQYTFTKNGSNDYSVSISTKKFVSQAEKDAWNAKQDALSAGTGIEISGNVISATGGGGAAYSAGTNISIDTANTINCTLPIRTDGTYGGKGIILGNGNGMYSKGATSIVGGDWVSASTNAHYSVGLGSWINLSNENEFGCGKHTKTNRASSTFGDSGNTLFAVGNGTSSLAHNAFEIRQNGDIYVNDGTNDVRLQDTILALGGLKFVQCSQSEYDALVSGGTVDSSTIYFITNVVS